MAAFQTVARAEPKEDVEAATKHFRQAEAYLRVQAYEEAIEEYERAFELVSKPGFLFNIGLAYEKKGDSEKALAHYRRYLELDPEGAVSAEARARVLRLERLLRQAAGHDTAPPAGGAIVEPGSRLSAPAPRGVPRRQPATADPESDHRPDGEVVGTPVAPRSRSGVVIGGGVGAGFSPSLGGIPGEGSSYVVGPDLLIRGGYQWRGTHVGLEVGLISLTGRQGPRDGAALGEETGNVYPLVAEEELSFQGGMIGIFGAVVRGDPWRALVGISAGVVLGEVDYSRAASIQVGLDETVEHGPERFRMDARYVYVAPRFGVGRRVSSVTIGVSARFDLLVATNQPFGEERLVSVPSSESVALARDPLTGRFLFFATPMVTASFELH